MKHFRFEFNRMKKILISCTVITGSLQLLFLYFFALVGRFDTSENDSMLTGYMAVLGLATTGTMCVLAIYGSILASQLLVRDYVGMNKSKTYLLPTDRKKLFYTKVAVLSSIISVSEVMGLLFSNIIYNTLGIFIPLTIDNPINHIGNMIVSVIICICLTLLIILFSSFIGILMNSTVKVIITSIIFVVFLSNLSAILLSSFLILSLFISVLIIIIIILVSRSMGKYIEKSEAI
ncbi:ABC transporter permease [Dellaglioa sp. L3N]